MPLLVNSFIQKDYFSTASSVHFEQYLGGGNFICFVYNTAQNDKSKGDVNPSSLKIGSVPNWMNQFQIPKMQKYRKMKIRLPYGTCRQNIARIFVDALLV